ncbi:MAG: hypothetical protein DWQ42_18365 [Planctomycetota bacterium]|nr:MAG: hypothetical protein DWQ42_18365 [Planctomycetota bacterium]REK44512.1 MAG: hypothetical protein DWQ46_09650 [Planctomycetota bacterium]
MVAFSPPLEFRYKHGPSRGRKGPLPGRRGLMVSARQMRSKGGAAAQNFVRRSAKKRPHPGKERAAGASPAAGVESVRLDAD